MKGKRNSLMWRQTAKLFCQFVYSPCFQFFKYLFRYVFVFISFGGLRWTTFVQPAGCSQCYIICLCIIHICLSCHVPIGWSYADINTPTCLLRHISVDSRRSLDYGVGSLRLRCTVVCLAEYDADGAPAHYFRCIYACSTDLAGRPTYCERCSMLFTTRLPVTAALCNACDILYAATSSNLKHTVVTTD